MSGQKIDFDGASIPELVGYMESDTAELRGDAACALGDRLRTRELYRLDSNVQNTLAGLLDDPYPLVRLEAAIALAEVHDSRATRLLLAATRARQHRLDAIRALGTLGDPEAIQPLKRIMQRRLMAWADKLQAAAALCALGDSNGASYLAERLSSRRLAERAAAAHFLGESRHPRARALLEPILAQTDHELRDTVARALGLLGDKDAKPALLAARDSADPALRDDIDRSLAQLEKSYVPEDA